MLSHIRVFDILTTVAATLLFSTLTFASLDRGQIQGTVTDPQGAVMPGVAVVVTNVNTGVQVRLKTNRAGFYLAQDLVPGKYTVRVEAAGFSSLEITDLTTTAGATTTADAAMKVGPTTQSVEVKAETPLVETTSSNFTTVLDRNYIENMPLQGRDIQNLVQLIPGVIQSAGPSGATFGFNSQFGGFPDPLHLVGSSISANGGQAGANAWYLEGVTNGTVGAQAVVVNPSPDAVSEFNFVDNGLAAEYGQTSGAVVNVVLKSGTNKLHGDIYEFNRNSYFDATNPFAQRDAKGNPYFQPATNYNDFGGTLGGPVVLPGLYNGKNRTFFFASWDVSMLHERKNSLLTVPTASERNGNFTDNPKFAPNCGPDYPLVANCLYDPFTTAFDSQQGTYSRTAFPTPIVPTTRMDPVAKFYVSTFPNPNYTDPLQQGPSGCKDLCNNYFGAVGSSMTTHNVSVKIDHNLGDKHKLFVAWLYNPFYYTNFRFPWDGPTAQTNTGIAGAQNYNTLNQLAVLGLTSTFSPTVVNEFRFSFGRQNMISLPNSDTVTGNQEVLQHVSGLNFLLSAPFQPVPTISFEGPIGYGNYTSFGPIQYQNGSMGQQAWTAVDNVTWVRGKHTLKFGGLFQVNNLWANQGVGYNIGFDHSLTSQGTSDIGGDGLATFLLGTVGQGGASTGVQYAPYQTNKDYSLYAQDEFRVKPNLTLSLGLRWDVYGWISERHNMLANYDLSVMNPDVPFKGAIVYMGTPQHPNHTLFSPNYNSFGPRIGFAWSPRGNKKTVIRGGFGIVYSNSMSALFGQGNGAFSTPGESVSASIPVTDYSYTSPSFILSQGAPTITLPNLASYRAHNYQFVGDATSIFGFMKAPHDPYVQQWSLFVQRELPGNMMVSAGYVGSHGVHLLGEEIRNLDYPSTKVQQQVRYNINNNEYPLGPSMANVWDCGPDGNTCSGWYGLLPYPQWYGSVQNLLSPDGYNRYESAQFRFEKRYSQGLNFLVAYTYSKNMTSEGLGALVANTPGPTTISNRGVGRIAYVPGAAGGGSADHNGHVWSGDPDNRALYDSLSPDDIPYVLNIATTYELPLGKGKHFLNHGRATNAILGGWRLSQNWNFQSGVPMYFQSIACNDLYGAHNSCLPDLIGNLAAGRGSETRAQKEMQWYNPNALAPPWGTDPNLLSEMTTGGYDLSGNYVDPNTVDAFWKFGNSGLRPPSGRTPGFWNADMSLGKDFHVSEARYLTFRWDVFNALNHQSLGIPNNTWCQVPYADGSTDATHVAGCSFGMITNTQTDPRSMQFSLKFYW